MSDFQILLEACDRLRAISASANEQLEHALSLRNEARDNALLATQRLAEYIGERVIVYKGQAYSTTLRQGAPQVDVIDVEVLG